MRSEDKLEVTVKRMQQFDDKEWVFVRHKHTGFVFIPSFEDLFRFIQAICHCEDKKYPDGRGREMVRDFLWDACEEGISFELLALKYEIPLRDK